MLYNDNITTDPKRQMVQFSGEIKEESSNFDIVNFFPAN